MENMLRSEHELRNGLIETLRARHPEATEAALTQRVDAFLASTDWHDDDVSEAWKQRWRDDRAAERAEKRKRAK